MFQNTQKIRSLYLNVTPVYIQQFDPNYKQKVITWGEETYLSFSILQNTVQY